MRISIVGCGWLGLALGKSLADARHTVLGSTTSADKLQTVRDHGIEPFLFQLTPMPSGKSFNELFKTDLLFVNIPPGRRRNSPKFYEEQIKYLSYLINQHAVPRVIFISSTSYYPSINDWVDTSTPYDLNKGSNKAVVQAEKQIAKVKAELLILRCGGLMGGDRIPGKWFSGKPTGGANTPVNYIHREDIIALVDELIKSPKWEQSVLNVVNPNHPTRKEVHEAMAKKYGFAPPLWQAPEITKHKLIKSDISPSVLKYSSPLDY